MASSVVAMDQFARDLRYGLRTLARSPGLVVVLVSCLGLGIGVNTTLFTLFNVTVLQGATARDPGRLVQIEPGNGDQISYLNYRDLRGLPAFEDLAIGASVALNWRQGDRLERLSGLQVSANYFQLLGVNAALGRTFAADEGDPARPNPVLVLDHAFWRERLDANPAIVGRELYLNGEAFTVAGVLPKGFRPGMGLFRPDAYVPVGAHVSSGSDDRRVGRFELRGRLAPGVTRQQASSAFTIAARELERTYPVQNTGLGERALVLPLTGWGTLQGRGVPSEVPILLAAPFVFFGLLLAIACANVAGVLLARGANRRHEIAVRLALGAGRGRLVRMLLAESLIICVLATGSGLAATAVFLPLLARVQLPNLGALQLPAFQIDGYLTAYALAIAALTCLFCGLVPALQATRAALSAGLRESALGSRRRRLRTAIVVGQVAMSVLLLTTAMMFLRGLLRVATVDPGFDVSHGITARIASEGNQIGDAARHLLADQAIERVSALPGVRSASVASLIPLGGNSIGRRALVRDRPDWGGLRVSVSSVGPRFFETMGIRVTQGREFQRSDRTGAPLVVIVNESFVRLADMGTTAAGRQIKVLSSPDEPWREIAGIVADSKYASLSESPQPQVFLPYFQTGGELFVQVRTAAAPSLSLGLVRDALIGPEGRAIVDVRTTEEATSLEFTLRRLGTWLLGALGGVGLLMTTIGLFGMLAWDVSRRTAEIGIRMALGASRRAVRHGIVRDGVTLTVVGTVLGLTLAVPLTLPIRGFLAGVTPGDPVTIGAIATLFLFVAVLASWIPAHRASGIDPTTALRRE